MSDSPTGRRPAPAGPAIQNIPPRTPLGREIARLFREGQTAPALSLDELLDKIPFGGKRKDDERSR